MRRFSFPVFALAAMIAGATPAGQQRETSGRLFPPEQLVLLEAPDRDEWQQPDRIMDRLNIADGARVADIGAGGGWFTIRLARRVGPNGKVFAEDIQQQMVESITRRVEDTQDASCSSRVWGRRSMRSRAFAGGHRSSTRRSRDRSTR